MLRNELEFGGKLLSDPIWAVSKGLHSYALKAKTTDTACRNIEVVVKNGKISFKYHPGSFRNENVIPSAYSLMYRHNPAFSAPPRHWYFGDIKIKVKSEKLYWTKDSFLKNVTAPFDPNIKIPGVVRKFYDAFISDFDRFWEFVEQEHASLLKKFSERGEEKGLGKEDSLAKTEGLKNYGWLFLHFNMTSLTSREHWYETDGVVEALDATEMKSLENSGDIFQYNKFFDRYSLLIKPIHTCGSGTDSNDNQFVGFDSGQRHKSLSLDKKELRTALFYYQAIMRACKIKIPHTWPYFLRLVPVGPFSPSDAYDFLGHLGVSVIDEEDVESAEGSVEGAVGNLKDFLSEAVEKSAKDITSFDLILVRNEKTDTNLTEINSISRSTLLKTLKKIKMAVKMAGLGDGSLEPVVNAFYNIHKAIGKEEKHQVKCVRAIMKIYRDVYYGDPDLIRIFVEQALKDIRNLGFAAFRNFHWQQSSYKLLTALAKGVNVQVNVSEAVKKAEIESAELGKLLARVSWPLNLCINSFTKAQVGQISSRILGSDPLPSIKELFVRYDCQVKMHEGEMAGRKRVLPDGCSYCEAEKKMAALREDNVKIDKYSFINGFLAETHLKMFLSTENRTEKK